MAKYDGNIKLISGLTQANGQDFPLMDAHAVQIDDEGTRLDAKIIELDNKAIDEDQVNDIISNNKDIQDTIQIIPTIAGIEGDIIQVKKDIEDIHNEVQIGDNSKLKMHYDENTSQLYLYGAEENEEFNPDLAYAQVTIKGGGGSGSAAAYSLSLARVGESSSYTIRYGEQHSIGCIPTIKSEESDTAGLMVQLVLQAGVDASSYVQKESITVENGKEAWFDITRYLQVGSNSIKIIARFTDDDGAIYTKSIIWNISTIDMYLTSAFDDSKVITANSVNVSYTPYGSITKTIHFILDGHEMPSLTTSAAGRELSVQIANQTHGAHTLEIYSEAVIADRQVRTDSLYFDLLFAKAGNDTPIIRANYPRKEYQQYDLIPIKYTVYSPKKALSDIKLVVGEKVVSSLTVDSTEQLWNFRPDDFGTQTIQIKCGESKKEIVLEINKFPFDVTPVEGVKVDFNPQGRTNQDSDYQFFTYEGYNNILTANNALATSRNFDWINGGWQLDENGDSCFVIKAGNRIYLDYDPFYPEQNENIKDSGREFKIIYKVSNVFDINTTFLSCYENISKVGIRMKAHNTYISSNLDSVEVPLSEEDIVEFEYNITSKAKSGIPMVMTYEDGVASRPLVYTDMDSFNHMDKQMLAIGSDDCDVIIYRLKIYEKALSNRDILTNFCADARTGAEIGSRYLRNRIYNDSDILTPDSVAAACPDLRVIVISAPYFTNDKNNKISGTNIRYIYKNGDALLDNWTATNVTHNGQGTSSNEYGLAGRNLDLSLKNKNSVIITYSFKKDCYDSKQEMIPAGTITDQVSAPFYNKVENEFIEITKEQQDEFFTYTQTVIPGTIITLGDGQTTVKKISLTRDSVPTNYLNIKVNIASSDNANNALLQKRYERYIPYVSGAKNRVQLSNNITGKKEPLPKNSMEFYNCVVFIQETDPDLTKHREFADNDIHFYAIGNVGDSKKTDSTRASDPDDPNEFCVEIMDWSRDLATFRPNTMGLKMWRVDNPIASDLSKYFDQVIENGKETYVPTKDESILPDKIYYAEQMIDVLENDQFDEKHWTYGFRYLQDKENKEQQENAKQKWIQFYRFLTRDLTNEQGVETTAKINAWKEEFKNWFILDSAIYYYLFTLRYTMVDNRAKNTFWHYGKCADGRYRFDFWDYDNDTSLGINNVGALTMTYGVEDMDTDESNSYLFRGAESTFFTRLAKYFSQEIEAMYKVLDNSDCFNSNSLIGEFDKWQAQFPEELWRLDIERKYERTYIGKELNNEITKDSKFLLTMLNGRKKYQRRQFERDQEFYMASKFRSQKNADDNIMFRCAKPEGQLVVPLDYTLHITPYSNMYINIKQDTDTYVSGIKCKAGEEVEIALPSLDFVIITGASHISSLGDLSKFYMYSASFSAGKKLKEIILGNSTPGYSNIAFDSLSFGENPLLEYINIKNLPRLTSAFDLSALTHLKKIEAQGSGITGISFADGGFLEEAYLPGSLITLKVKDLDYISELSIDNYEALNNLTIENCPNINSLEIVKKAINLTDLIITNINWSLENTDLLNRLYNLRNSKITGEVELYSTRLAELAKYKEKWPDLTIKYTQLIEQYSVEFRNWDNSILYSTLVDQGELWIDPVEAGLIPIPTREPTAQYTFEYVGWETSPGAVLKETIIRVKPYKETIRNYTVRWLDTFNNIYDTVTVPYGSNVIYPGETPQRAKSGLTYFLFNGWDKSTTFIDKNIDVKVQWLEGTIPPEPDVDEYLMSTYNPAQIKGIIEEGYADNKYNYFKVGDHITIPLGYMPEFNSIEEQILVDLDEPIILDGQTHKDTGINLFNMNKSFTLVIDYTVNANDRVNTDKYVLASCTNTSQVNTEPGGAPGGFNLFAQKLAASAVSELQVYCGWGADPFDTGEPLFKSGPSYPVDYHTASGSEQQLERYMFGRDIVVIRYSIKEPENLYCYINNRYSNDDNHYKIHKFIHSITPHFSQSLVFGASRNYDGSKFEKFGEGKINFAKIWFDDLGETECQKICTWIHQKVDFDYVGSGKYLLKETNKGSNATFIANTVLDRPVKYKGSAFTTVDSWTSSTIRKWLNQQVYSAIPAVWRDLIKTTMLKTFKGGPYAQTMKDIITTEDCIYLPAVFELSGGNNTYTGGNYSKEVYDDSINGMYPIFTNDETRKKDYRYWTRTPRLTNTDNTPYQTMTIIEDDGTIQDLIVYPSYYNVYALPCFSM